MQNSFAPNFEEIGRSW